MLAPAYWGHCLYSGLVHGRAPAATSQKFHKKPSGVFSKHSYPGCYRNDKGTRAFLSVCCGWELLCWGEISNFGPAEHEMQPAVWQGAELAVGAEMAQCPLSVGKGSWILLSAGLFGHEVALFLCYAATTCTAPRLRIYTTC